MAVRVFSNNLPYPQVRAAVQEAVLEAMGTLAGDWMVQIHEEQNSPSWFITIWGPNNFHWNQEFSGIEEQNAQDGYAFIKRAISEVLRPVLYLSYAYPDNSDGFVNKLRDRLAQELQVQTGEPTEVVLDSDRMRPSALWSNDAERLIGRATFLVPVVSPSYFKSDFCRKEFESFLGREQQTGRKLILPVYFVTAGELDESHRSNDSIWIQTLRSRNTFDLRQFRFDLTSTKALRTVANLARSVHDVQVKIRSGKAVAISVRPEPLTNASDPLFIQSLRLTNFRCFDQIELQFDRPSMLDGRWTCIAGINGSGKSTVLQGLGIALLGNPLALELGGERLSHMRRRVNQLSQERATIEANLKAPESDESLQLRLAIDESKIVSIEGPAFVQPLPVASWDRVRQLVIAAYGATRNLASQIDAGSANLSPDVRHQITLFDPLSQLAGAEVLVGRQSGSWPFLELLQNVVEQLFSTDLEIILDRASSGIRFTVSKKDNVEAIDLPDGFRSAVAWLADLCFIWSEKAPSLAASINPAEMHAIVLIDEIDLHLHPSLQRELIPRLRKTFPKVQWIVTTHSPLVLSNFDSNEIIALDRDSDGNIRELDRQILGFSADEIYDWLMGTRPRGAALEEKVKEADEDSGENRDAVARLMRTSPTADDDAARAQVAQFKELLKKF